MQIQVGTPHTKARSKVRLIASDLYGVLVDPPPWADRTMLHVVWEDDDYICVYAPEELESVNELNNQNAAAVARQAGDKIDEILRHFQHNDTWETFGPGRNEVYLEQVKMDLTMLASVVEARIQEISPSVVQEFGT